MKYPVGVGREPNDGEPAPVEDHEEAGGRGEEGGESGAEEELEEARKGWAPRDLELQMTRIRSIREWHWTSRRRLAVPRSRRKMFQTPLSISVRAAQLRSGALMGGDAYLSVITLRHNPRSALRLGLKPGWRA